MKYYVVHAFAEKIFEGNQAGVCVMGKWPSDELMQKIAFDNNLSETAFSVKEGDAYHIRWFTPGYEIDLCGHATLGTAYVIHNFIEPELKEIKFTSMSGPLKAKVEGNYILLDFPTKMPKKIAAIPEVEEILGVKIKETYLARDLMVVIEDEKQLKALEPNFEKMKQLETGDGIIVTCKSKTYDFVSRAFYPKCGVNEDPVTGSAHCNLIPYWAEKLGKTEMSAKQVSNRGGLVKCRLLGDRVEIGGSAVIYMEGDIKAED